MQTAELAGPRLLSAHEVAGCVRAFREARHWSQETLAALSRLSVRTVQRVERGEPSDTDTRRALAHAFDADDVDVFNKPYTIPTVEELKAQREQFDRDHVILDLSGPTSGRELVSAFESAAMDSSTLAVELDPESASKFGRFDRLPSRVPRLGGFLR
jgi:transcriptional regulator with XRE-family HTH domain